VRLYLSAPSVGLNYQILDNNEVIMSSGKSLKSQMIVFDQITAGENYKLVIEYTSLSDVDCPFVEIDFIVEPLKRHQIELQCTKEEVKAA